MKATSRYTIEGEGAASAAPSVKTRATLNWTAVRKTVRCQRDHDEITEWKQEGQCLFVEDRLPWLIAEHAAEEDAE